MTSVPYVPLPGARPLDPALLRVAAVLDPVLTPLGFTGGQPGASDADAQVIFCRGLIDSTDGACVDLVVDLRATPAWRITEVRYWGFPGDRWQLAFPHERELEAQLSELARTLPDQLS